MTTFSSTDTAKRGAKRVSFGRFLIPLDGSDLAAGIIPVAADLAKRLGARIDLLAVIDPETTDTVWNVIRLETMGSPDIGWIRVIVDTIGPDLFSFEPRHLGSAWW